jgi:hypothetical protein
LYNSSRRRGGKTLLAFALAAATIAISAASAGAATFCIDVAGANCPVGATAYSGAGGLTTALSDSVSNGAGQDTIFIGSGTYVAATGWDAQTSNVMLTGVGPTRPVLSVPAGAPASTTVLSIANASAQISNLAFLTASSTGAAGIASLTGGASISDVEVSSPGDDGATGIKIQGQGSSIQRANINLPYGTKHSDAITGSAASSLLVNDTVVSAASRAFYFFNGSANVQVRRASANSCVGAEFQNSWGTVSSSLLVAPVSGAACAGTASGVFQSIDDGLDYTSKPVQSFNNTIVGHGYTSGGGVHADINANNSTAWIKVDSTVIYGYDKAFACTGVGTNSAAVVSVDFSRYQGSTSSATLLSEASPLNGDPAFVNPGGGDYRLQKTSQLIDVGDPAALTQSESSTDLSGSPRIASRGAGNIRDIGAYELSNGAPAASIVIATPHPVTTSPTTFSGSGSTDPDGDPLTYSWRFDNGQVSIGENVNRTITSNGPHSVELTVTDSTGVTATTSAQYSVDKGSLNLALNSKAIRATGRGNFSVKLFCPDQASSNCNGKLLFQTTGKKPLKAAAYVFSVEPGTTRKLPITTYKSFRKLLIKQKKVKLKMSVNGTTGNASLTGKSTIFSLSAPKPKKR